MTHLEFETNNCYANTTWQGMTLAEWQEELKFRYSLGELYRLMKEKADFTRL